MSDRFQRAFDAVIGHEGGFKKEYEDRGDWDSGVVGVGKLIGTKFGLSAMTYAGEIDIPHATLDEAKRLYKRDFWDKLDCDALPEGVAFLVFDFAVNAGRRAAVRALQRAAGATVDGTLGPKTRKVVAAVDPERLMRGFSVERAVHYGRLATFRTYGRGWMRRAFEAYDQARGFAAE